LRDVQQQIASTGQELVLGLASTQSFRYSITLNMGSASPEGTSDNGMKVCFDQLYYKTFDNDDAIVFNFEAADD